MLYLNSISQQQSHLGQQALSNTGVAPKALNKWNCFFSFYIAEHICQLSLYLESGNTQGTDGSIQIYKQFWKCSCKECSLFQMKWLHQIYCSWFNCAWTWKVHAYAKCLPSQFITASISHPKHFAHTLRPTTCVAFGSLLTPDMVTDGRGSKLSQREISMNSTECQKHLIAAQERLKGYICSTLLLVGFSAWTGNLTPAGVQGSGTHRPFHVRVNLFNNNADFCVSVESSYFLTNPFSFTVRTNRITCPHTHKHTASDWGKSEIMPWKGAV